MVSIIISIFFLTASSLFATPVCERFLRTHAELPYGWYSKARSFDVNAHSDEAQQWISGQQLGEFRIRAFWLRDLAQHASADELRQIIAQHQIFVAQIYGRNSRFALNSYELACCGWEDVWFAAHTGFISITDANGEIQMMLRLYYYDFELEYRFNDRVEIAAQILLPSERWSHLQQHQNHVGRALFDTPQPLFASHKELLSQLSQAQTREQRRALHRTHQLGELTRYSADPAFRRPANTTSKITEARRFLMRQRNILRMVFKSGKSSSSVHDRFFARRFGFEKIEALGSDSYFKVDY